jgi:hypothetical protein
MGFNQEKAEQLLADTGRRCCICSSLHNVQLHHIIPLDFMGEIFIPIPRDTGSINRSTPLKKLLKTSP